MDWLVNNLGSIVPVFTALVATIVTIVTIKGDVKHLSLKIDKLEKKTDDLEAVVLSLAKQEGRIYALEQIVIQQGHRLDSTATRIDKVMQKDFTGDA